MYTLGINAAFHDPAACLVHDGDVIAAAEDERFTHVKHDKRPVPFTAWELPFHAIEYCLAEAGIQMTDVDHVAYSFDPGLLLGRRIGHATVPIPLQPGPNQLTSKGFQTPWDPLFLASITNAPGFLADGVPHHLKARFRGVDGGRSHCWHWVPHHLAHAASAFHCSPFESAAVMTLDGRGEKSHNGLCAQSEQSPRVARTGHDAALAGNALRTGHRLSRLSPFKRRIQGDGPRVVWQADARRRVSQDCSSRSERPVHNRTAQLRRTFGPARVRGAKFEARHYDIAHSLQVVLEETVPELAHWFAKETNSPNLCMAGGVALNCVMNARLRDRGPFKTIWVQPAAGDAGTVLGAALWTDIRIRGDDTRRYVMDHAFLGPNYSDEQIESFLKWTGVKYRRMENVAEETVDLLVQDKVIGWYQGRMEFGPARWGPVRSSLRRFIPICRHGSTISKTARTFAPSRLSCWRRTPRNGSRTATSLHSCSSFSMYMKTRRCAFPRSAMSTARPAFKPSTASSMRSTTIS